MQRRTDEDYGRIAYRAFVKDNEMDLTSSLGWNGLPLHAKNNWVKAATAVILTACKDMETELLSRPAKEG